MSKSIGKNRNVLYVIASRNVSRERIIRKPLKLTSCEVYVSTNCERLLKLGIMKTELLCYILHNSYLQRANHEAGCGIQLT